MQMLAGTYRLELRSRIKYGKHSRLLATECFKSSVFWGGVITRAHSTEHHSMGCTFENSKWWSNPFLPVASMLGLFVGLDRVLDSVELEAAAGIRGASTPEVRRWSVRTDSDALSTVDATASVPPTCVCLSVVFR